MLIFSNFFQHHIREENRCQRSNCSKDAQILTSKGVTISSLHLTASYTTTCATETKMSQGVSTHSLHRQEQNTVCNSSRRYVYHVVASYLLEQANRARSQGYPTDRFYALWNGRPICTLHY